MSLNDLAKAALCFLTGLGWVAVVVRFVPDTSLGAAIVGVPSVTLIAVGGLFFGRWRMGLPK